MRIQVGREFWAWYEQVRADGGAAHDWLLALLGELARLRERPREESATFKRVRSARRYEGWRVAHPFDPAVAVRVLCWFPDDKKVVIAVYGGDKKQLGNDWYISATRYAEQFIDAMLKEG